MRGTTELDSIAFLNFKDHRRMKTKDNLSESRIKPFMKFEVYYESFKSYFIGRSRVRSSRLKFI